MGNSFIMVGDNKPTLIFKASLRPTPGIPVTTSSPSSYTIISRKTFDLRDYSKD